MFFSVFFLFILFQSALANEVRSGSILENVYKHENDQKQFQKGNEKECGSALGVYDIQYGNDKKKVYFEAPHRSQLPFLDPNKNTAIFEMFSANSPKPKRTGMLISRDDKWFLIELNEGVTHPYPSIYQTTAIYAAFVEYYEKGNKNPNGVKIRELTFSSDMLKQMRKVNQKIKK